MNKIGFGYFILMIALVIIASNKSKSKAGQKQETMRANRPANKKKGSAGSKKIPSHLEKREEVITGQNGYIPKADSKAKRSVALRLMEGDPVPEGYQGVACHYCGAVNMIKKNSAAKHSCYFCREPID